MMHPQTHTTHRGQPASGGVILGVFASINLTPKPKPAQSAECDVVTITEAGLAEIIKARHLAKTALTDERRAYFNRVADDVATWLATDVMKFLNKPPAHMRGRLHPPTLGDLKYFLGLHQKIKAARDKIAAADAEVRACWASKDIRKWCKWESHMAEMGRWESKMHELQREANPSWNS